MKNASSQHHNAPGRTALMILRHVTAIVAFCILLTGCQGKQQSKVATRDDTSLVTFLRTGSPSTEFIGAAESLPADLIVISTHGRTGLKHVFLGSVAEHVVQRAPCPVLVVREHEREILAPLVAA